MQLTSLSSCRPEPPLRSSACFPMRDDGGRRRYNVASFCDSLSALLLSLCLSLSLSIDRQPRHFKEWQTGVAASPSQPRQPRATVQVSARCLSPLTSVTDSQPSASRVALCITHTAVRRGSGAATTASSADTRHDHSFSPTSSQSAHPLPPSTAPLHGLHSSAALSSTPPPSSLPFRSHTFTIVIISV